MNFLKNILQKEGKETIVHKEKESKLETFLNPKKDNFNECVICLEEMKTGQELTIILCSHIYHSKCIRDWALKKKICPLCDYSFE